MCEKTLFETASGKKISYGTKHGIEVYRRSLVMLLQCALQEMYQGLRFQVGQTLMHGYYFEPVAEKAIPEGLIKAVEKRMEKLVEDRKKFKVKKVSSCKAIEMFSNAGLQDKARAACWLRREEVSLVFLKNYFDFMFLDCVSNTGILSTFRLLRYNNGFVLQYPGNKISKLPRNPDKQKKLFKVYEETKEWNDILGIHHVPDLNRAVNADAKFNLIKIQEAFHEKKIVHIADSINEENPEKNIVFISGPSSSGKTTFVKRLAIQLRVNGLIPQMLHLDDYFLPRKQTPLTPKGELDYESFRAMDIGLFKSHMKDFLKGRKVILPDFDFKSGKRKKSKKHIRITPKTVVLIEGIHGLNPKLTECVKEKNQIKIFVSALTQLCIDYSSRIFTSDSRLMRRIVRDSMFRNHLAIETLRRFPMVREGEEKYVFPFQNRADIFFNSSLIYEQAVLKSYLEKLLKDIKPSQSSKYYEACRLLNYLEFFESVDSDNVPRTSILREFIGDSGFHY